SSGLKPPAAYATVPAPPGGRGAPGHVQWDGELLRMLGRLLAFALISAFALSGAPPSPAAAQEMKVAANLLAAPKGRLAARKRLVHPSLPSPSSGGGGGHGPEAFKWFWTEVSTSRSAANDARWAEVLTVIENARAKGRPVFGSRATARRIAEAYGPHLTREA